MKDSKTLWTVLKKIYKFIIPDPIEGCNGSCEYNVPCDCGHYGGPEKKIGISKSCSEPQKIKI